MRNAIIGLQYFAKKWRFVWNYLSSEFDKVSIILLKFLPGNQIIRVSGDFRTKSCALSLWWYSCFGIKVRGALMCVSCRLLSSYCWISLLSAIYSNTPWYCRTVQQWLDTKLHCRLTWSQIRFVFVFVQIQNEKYLHLEFNALTKYSRFRLQPEIH